MNLTAISSAGNAFPDISSAVPSVSTKENTISYK
jgi:hypothetical protein